VGAEVAQQPAPDQRRDGEPGGEHGGLGRLVVADGADEQQQERERDQHQAQPAVEASGLGVRPRVEGAHDLPSVVGVGAGVLARAGVADVRLRAVAHDAALVVELVGP
jgi:hypothetical protein